MERLTKYSNDLIRNKAVNILRKLDSENGLDGDELAFISSFCLIERVENKQLKKYEDLEEQNRLLKLPCKAGQKVCLLRKDIKTVIDGEITSIRIGEFASDMKIFMIDDNRYTDASFDKIGDIVFFTKEEAEAALKEL